MGQGRFGHDRILSGVIVCHVVGNNGVFPERGSRGPCVGFWGPGSIWQRMWYFCAKFLWIKGVFYHGLCVIIYASDESHTQWLKRSGSKFFPGNNYPCFPTPPPYWLVTQRVYRGNLADQLRLLQLPQPGTHQHRPHTEDAVTPTNSLHQGDRPAPLACPTGTRRGDSVITDVIMTLFSRRVSPGQKRQPNNTVGAAAIHRWRTADRTMDARKNIEKSGSSLYARQPHLASTYGSKNSLTPPHSTSLLYYPSEFRNRKGTGHTRKNTENTRRKHYHWNFNGNSSGWKTEPSLNARLESLDQL